MRVCSSSCIKRALFLLTIISATVIAALADIDSNEDHINQGLSHLRAHKLSDALTVTDEEEMGVSVDSSCHRMIKTCVFDSLNCYNICAPSCSDLNGECARGNSLNPSCVQKCEARCDQMCPHTNPNMRPEFGWRAPDWCNDWVCGTTCIAYYGGTSLICGHLYCNGEREFTNCSYDPKCWAKIPNKCPNYYKPVY